MDNYRQTMFPTYSLEGAETGCTSTDSPEDPYTRSSTVWGGLEIENINSYTCSDYAQLAPVPLRVIANCQRLA